LSPPFFASDAALPATDVAVNETALRAPEVALRTFAPIVGPRVQEPTVAIPESLVVAFAPETEPPPLTTEKVTGAPDNGDPFWSLTRTDGAGPTTVPATPVSAVEELAAIAVATSGTVGVFSPPLQPRNVRRMKAAVSVAGPMENFFT
jgi:hypothetical protein